MQHCPHAHEKQGFVDDMNKGMRHRPIERQFAANPDSHNHESQLVVQAERQYPAQIIFDHRKEYRQRRHCRANPDQIFGAGETARQRIDRQFGGKGR